MNFFTTILTFLKNFFLNKNLNFYLKKIIEIFSTQFILTIAIIPLYSKFGIPLTFLGFFGNIIFSPFLFLFLLFSTINFIFFIFGIENFLIIFLLKKILKIWIFFMEKITENKIFYIFFPEHPYLYFVFCWSFFLILILFKSNKKITEIKFFLISCLFFIFSIFLPFFIKDKNNFLYLDPFSKKAVIFHKTKNSIHIFDYSTKSKKIDKFYKFLLYNISPALVKNFKKKSIKSYNFMLLKNKTFSNSPIKIRPSKSIFLETEFTEKKLSKIIKTFFINENIKFNFKT